METKEEEVPRYDIIIKNGVKHFEPDIISHRYMLEHTIFPVPLPNAVGGLGPLCVSLIEFDDTGKVKVSKILSAKTIYDIGFLHRYSTNFSDDMIVFSKTRIVVMVNVKTKTMFHRGFGLSLNYYIRGISFLDPQNNLLVIVASYNDIRTDLTDSLHLAKWDGERLIDLGVIMHKCYQGGDYSSDILGHNYWLVHDRTLFVHDRLRSKNMLVFNGLTETSHPFAKIFNDNKERIRDLKNFTIHPHLPFGILAEDESLDNTLTISEYMALPSSAQDMYWETLDKTIITDPLHILRWNTDDPDEQFASFNLKLLPLIPFFENVKQMAFAYPSFSPDGKWLVLGCFQYDMFREAPHFIAIPIDPDNPEFLNIGELIVLGKVENIHAIAWSTNPTSFIVGKIGALYKWNLEELRNARTITVPKPGSGGGSKNDGTKKSIFRRIGGLFGGKK